MATPPVPQSVPESEAAAPPAVSPPPPPVLPQPHPHPVAGTGELQKQATIDELPGHNPGIELDFWQKPWVQDLLPIITSVVLHMGIIAIGVVTYKTAQVLMTSSKEPVVIPDATIVENV